MNRQELTTAYMALVIVTGVVCLAVALALFPFEKIDFTLVLLAAFTIGVGSRITVPIPRLKSRISVSDTFIFLVLLIYGGEAAVVLSAVEAFCSSCWKKLVLRLSRREIAQIKSDFFRRLRPSKPLHWAGPRQWALIKR